MKFFGRVLPTAKKITYNIHIKRTINRSLILGIADGNVSVDGREITGAEGLRVGLFTSPTASEGFSACVASYRRSGQKRLDVEEKLLSFA